MYNSLICHDLPRDTGQDEAITRAIAAGRKYRGSAKESVDKKMTLVGVGSGASRLYISENEKYWIKTQYNFELNLSNLSSIVRTCQLLLTLFFKDPIGFTGYFL